METKNSVGQYFTTNKLLKNKVQEFIQNKPYCILEPSVGRGDLIEFIYKNNNDIKFDMYEIDTTLGIIDGIPDNVIYGDFMNQTISKTYQTIIGNPPYVRTKNGNLYIDFTEKCYNLLENNGELIFIVPSDFFKLTSASKILNTMMTNGSFTHVFHPHNENLFEGASIDVIVFRYCKNNSIEKKVLYNDEVFYIINGDGLITFEKEQNKETMLLKDCFDIYVGIVTGKEEVYKNEELGNIEVLNGENKTEKYIYIENYPCNNEKINTYLLKHKNVLINRKIKTFNENNWFEWGAPRNIITMKNNMGKDCIYIHNLTRKPIVSFIGKISYFGGSLIMLKPKNRYNLNNIVSYLNSDTFKNNFMFSGRFKIGHRQISNSSIPKEIMFSNTKN